MAAIDFACRSHAEIACRAITIATSHICDQSQHLCAAHHCNGSVRFFSSQRHSNCFTGSVGSVCARQHTRWSRFPLCMRQILTASTTKPVTTLPSTILATASLAPRCHSPALGQLLLILAFASVRVEDRLHHLLHHLATKLQFCALSSFLPAPMLCLGPLALLPRSSGLSSSAARGRCLACALLCAAQGCMSACRTRPVANPGGPQGGAQTGRSPGGAGRKLSRPRFETKCCGGGGPPPRQDRLLAL